MLPSDLAATIARTGVDISLPERKLEDAIRGTITDRRRYLDGWHYDDKGWCVRMHRPDEEEFRGTVLATALGLCLLYLIGDTREIGIGVVVA